jgi:hypothetical protein
LTQNWSHNIAWDYSLFFYAVTGYTTQTHKTRLELMVEEGCSHHLLMMLVLQYCQFLHYKINFYSFVNTPHTKTVIWEIGIEIQVAQQRVKGQTFCSAVMNHLML